MPGVLHSYRRAGDGCAGGGESVLDGACGGRERSDRGGAGSLFRFVSEGAGADVVLCVCGVGAGVDHPGLLVCAEFSERDGDRACGPETEYGWSGILGACGRVRLRSAAGENFRPAEGEVSVCGGVRIPAAWTLPAS